MTKKGRSLSRVMWPSSTGPPKPRHVAKIGRNEPCPCGSGTKYKDCHLKEGEAFLMKLAKKAEKDHLREVREQLKARGVPWYKRFLIRL